MNLLIKPTNEKARRISTGMMKIEVTGTQQQQQQQQQAQTSARSQAVRAGSLDHSTNMSVPVPTICSTEHRPSMTESISHRPSISQSPPRVTCTVTPPVTSVTPPAALPSAPGEASPQDLQRHRLSTSSAAPKLAPIASCEILPEPSSSDEEDTPTKHQPKLVTSSTSDVHKEVGDRESKQEREVARLETRSITLPDMTADDSTTDPPAEEPGPSTPHPKIVTKAQSTVNASSRRRGVVGGGPLSLSADIPDCESAPSSLQASPKRSCVKAKTLVRPTRFEVPPMHIPVENILDHTSLQPGSSPCSKRPVSPVRIVSPLSSPKKFASGSKPSSRASTPMSHSLSSPSVVPMAPSVAAPPSTPANLVTPQPMDPPGTLCANNSPPQHMPNRARASVVSWSSPLSTAASYITPGVGGSGKRPSAVSCPDPEIHYTPRPSIAPTESAGSPPCRPRAGAVVTSSRRSKRRSSNTAAAQAFAAATAGTANPPAPPPRAMGRYYSAGAQDLRPPVSSLQSKRMSIISTAATMRVLNVVRHWVSKFPEDFENDSELRESMKSLLEDLVCNQCLQPNEHKAAGTLLKQFLNDSFTNERCRVDLDQILTSVEVPSRESFDTLSAMSIAEQLTYLDHQIFTSITSGELLNQAWMKPMKQEKAKHVLLVSKRFNEVSCLVVSEVVSRSDLMDRVACIEKWTAIADICRCMHNYNGVLEICAALVNSSVYRLKRTWEKLPKQTRVSIERLQNLVSSDGRFKNMREALHRCDPPCIPYLGMYLTDLSFIEEGALNVTEDGLVNFCKMRMVAHVVREIQQYQEKPYKIEYNPKVCAYLLDPTRLLSEEQTYSRSLLIEPRQSIAGGQTGFGGTS